MKDLSCEAFIDWCDEMHITQENVSDTYAEEAHTETFKIWGRRLPLSIIYSAYGEEEIDKNQKASFADFKSHITEYTDRALDEVKAYIIDKYNNELNETIIDNIFKYVVPKSIFISKERHTKSNKKVVSLICDFKFDPEHDLAIKFTNGKDIEIGNSDIAGI